MTDPLPSDNLDPGLETLIRSAAELPEVSPDLRPRVIEAAIVARQRRWRRRRATVIAAVTLMFVALPPPAGQSPEDISVGQHTEQDTNAPHPTAYHDQLLASTSRLWDGAAAGSDWELVDRFTRLRQDHLRMLRQAFLVHTSISHTTNVAPPGSCQPVPDVGERQRRTAPSP